MFSEIKRTIADGSYTANITFIIDEQKFLIYKKVKLINVAGDYWTMEDINFIHKVLKEIIKFEGSNFYYTLVERKI